MTTLALAMMIKNEEKRITVSFDSVKDIIDTFIILDTGSTDSTLTIVREYCNKNNKKLYLIEKEFIDVFNFSTARNTLLDYADDKSDYLLLLDCNDELRNANELKSFTKGYNGESSAFHLCQEWWNGSSLDKYYNIRLVKTKNNWRYKGAIHEYITSNLVQENRNCISKIENVTIYQDRTKDDDKSFKRFTRDEQIFEEEYREYLLKKENDRECLPDTRSLFYYGQTCMCLGKNEKAYRIYKERLEQDGFLEEKYHSYFRCGELSKVLNHPWDITISWYLKAYDFSTSVFGVPRAEPLCRISEYYQSIQNWEMSYLYIKRCCDLSYPKNSVLFVDKRVYDYKRWHILGIVAYYVHEYKIGKIACSMAITAENKDLDIENLKFYENK